MLINNENAKRFHLKRVRSVICAAAPLANLDVQRFLEKFGEHIFMPQCKYFFKFGNFSHLIDIVPLIIF